MLKYNVRRRLFKIVLPAALAGLSVLIPEHLTAQAIAVRSREAELSGFVMYSNLSPDYGPTRDNGVALGADYTRYLRFVSPSLEFRFKTAQGSTVDQRTVGGGIKLEHPFGRFHPYGDFLISAGHIGFANKNAHGANGTGGNDSVVYSYGGGVDYDFARKWAARVDFQAENWDLNEIPDVKLSPMVISVGVVYRFRFGRDRF